MGVHCPTPAADTGYFHFFLSLAFCLFRNVNQDQFFIAK